MIGRSIELYSLEGNVKGSTFKLYPTFSKLAGIPNVCPIKDYKSTETKVCSKKASDFASATWTCPADRVQVDTRPTGGGGGYSFFIKKTQEK